MSAGGLEMNVHAPVDESSRLHGIDAARGLALLGIFFVNIQSFAEPFGSFMRPTPEPGALNWVSFYVVKVFCEGKFYPLFSMLFGMGLMLQRGRAVGAGREFGWLGARRLIVLMMIGLAHALGVWYGDILFMYAVCGLVLLLMSGLAARTLAIIAAGVAAAGMVVATAFFALLVFGAGPNPPVPGFEIVGPTEHYADPFGRLIEHFKDPAHQDKSPASLVWMTAETQAYAQGPYGQLFAMRAMSWLTYLVFSIPTFWWHVMVLMLFGAAMLKGGLFTEAGRAWRVRMAVIGLPVGIGLAVLAAALPGMGQGGKFVAGPLVMIGGPILSLGYLGAMCWLAERGAVVARLLANVGRMAMTNYLMQSLIATSVFYYYGLGWFGQTTRPERIGIVLAIFAAQIVLSTLWLSRFRFGPMEWLWRSLTYLRPQPLARSSSQAQARR